MRVRCSPDRYYNFLYDGSYSDRETRTLRPGSYTLYVFADRPVRIKLRLNRAAEGIVHLSPRPTSRIDLLPPTARQDQRPLATLWWAGESYTAGEVGLAFSLLYMRGRDLAGTRAQNCQYRLVPPPPAEVAYGPHCYNAAFYFGAGYDIFLPQDFSEREFVVLFLSTYHDQGTNFSNGLLGNGFYVQSPHRLSRLGVNALTLRLR